jgi:8-oxo-dGTP pyrophosphatase MutT (NUDIX family)
MAETRSDLIPPPCAGVVVLRRREQRVECLLVQTPTGQWGFPKGKRNRGEAVVDNALRELFEETGLMRLQIALREDLTFDERSDKGNLAVRYLAATLTDPDPTLIPAPGELTDVRWWSVDDALGLLKTARRDVLRAVLTVMGM